MQDSHPPRRIVPDVITTEAFDDVSWHDCHVWGLALRLGEMSDGDFTSDLVLDIDFIVEWLCGADRRATFRVAPATLVFHDVGELDLAARWSDGPVPPNVIHPVTPASIASVTRVAVERDDTRSSRWSWAIDLDARPRGFIRFTASGFTQSLRAEPVLQDEQRLTWKVREAMLGERA